MRGVGGVRKSIHQSRLAKGLGLGLLCRGFKGVQEEIPSEVANTLQIGSVAFHQNNAPVHISILVTDYLTKMGIKTAQHPPLLLATFGLRWGLSEVVGTVQVHCSRRRLCRKGTRVSYACYQWKSPYKKCLETYLMIFVYYRDQKSL